MLVPIRPDWRCPPSIARPKHGGHVIVWATKHGSSRNHDASLYVCLRTRAGGGFTVTCLALPGLVTYGETLQEAREMARDAMAGLIEGMLEKGEEIPESDAPEAMPRFNHLAHTLQAEGEPE